jgi:hypothetical protein
MFSISISDSDGRDATQESIWLPVGREYHRSLQGTHRLAIHVGGDELGAVKVHKAAGTLNILRADLLTLDPLAPRQVLAALVYSALREARIVGRTLADIVAGDHADAVRDIIRAPMHGFPDEVVRQRVDYGMYCSFAEAGAELQAVLADAFPSEVVRTVEDSLFNFFTTGAWAGAVRRGTLSRRQYVATLISLHSYVRYTTRLLGHCIGLCDAPALRAHYIEHLKGEINHELILERDLKNLGEDVDYVARHHQPTPATLAFMCIQESIVAFYRDPVLFLACPIAAEGFAAYVQLDILEGLKQSVSSWGLRKPAEVVHFVKSHSGFDGGLDGHWNHCIQVVNDYVRTDVQMQRFSSVLHASLTALAKNYDACVLEHAEPVA